MTTIIVCQKCENDFEFPKAEQDFRELHGLARPVLCPQCRQRERHRRNGELVNLYMQTDSFDPFLLGENTQAGNNTPRAARDGRRMYETVCAACGAYTQVPFIPRGDRPVYCRECYNSRKGR